MLWGRQRVTILKTVGIITATGIGLFIVAVVGINATMSPEERNRLNAIDEAKRAVSAILKDPDSAKFEDVEAYVHENGSIAVCGKVNSRNSFGAYAGAALFIVPAVGVGAIIEEPENEAVFEPLRAAGCTTLPATDPSSQATG
jgi:hypothetical protein